MRTIEHWIGGTTTSGTSTRTAPVWNPATGEQQAQVVLASRAGRRRRRRSAARRRSRSGRRRRSASAPRCSSPSASWSTPHVDELAELITDEHGKVLSDAARRGAARPGGHRVRLRHPAPAQGRLLRPGLHRRRHVLVPRAARRRRRHHAVQLPGDGADVDAPGGDRLRQRVRPQAERARPLRLAAASPSCGSRPACPTASSTSCTATRRPSTRCWTTPDVAAVSFVGSTPIAQLHPRAGPPRTASACRPSAARRTTRSSCPTPTSTSPPTTSPPPRSARPASAAWRSPPPSPSAPRATRVVEAVNARARAVKVGPGRDAGQRDGPGDHPGVPGPDRRADRHRREAGRPARRRRPRPGRARVTRTASSSAPP